MKFLRVFIIFIITCSFAYQPIISEIGIFENKHFSDKEILSIMKTKKTSKFRLWGKPKKLNIPLFELDLAQIKGFYVQNGFLDADVSSNIVFDKDDEEQVFLNIFIDEGPRYFVRNIIITGDSVEIFMKLQKKFILQKGEYFSPRMPNNDKAQLVNFAKNMGYPYVDITTEWSKIDLISIIIDKKDSSFVDSIDIELNIKLNKPAYFGDISYKNLHYAKEFILRRELQIKKGKPYELNKINRSKEDLYRTGLFSIVRINPENQDMQPDTLDITVSVFEKEPGWIGLKAGLKIDPSYDMTTDVTAEWGNRNVFGTGRTIIGRTISSFELINQWNNLSNRFELDYTEPWTLAKRLPITLNLYFEPNNSAITDRYNIRSYGTELFAKYKFKKNRHHLLSFSYDYIDKYNIQQVDSTETNYDVDENTVERKINYSFERDSRNNVLIPTDGTVFVFLNEFAGWALGGDEHYEKIELTWNRYQLLQKKYVYAFRLRSGYIKPLKYDGYQVDEHNRFFLGGSNTIRGVRERDLGPTYLDNDGIAQPEGGNFYLLSSFELRFPIYWRFHGQIFSDVGNLWGEIEDFKIEEMMLTTGWGISVITPFGPIRFDYGFQIINKFPNYNKSWHISILYAF